MLDIKDLENKIINADCMDILKQLPDKCIDLVLTDPPYGLNKKFKGGKSGKSVISSPNAIDLSANDNTTKGLITMECSTEQGLLQPILEKGFDGMQEALQTLFNLAMKIERERHLHAGLYQRTAERAVIAGVEQAEDRLGKRPETEAHRKGKQRRDAQA